MANLRAAIIGLGAMGKNHARVLKSLPGVDLVAVFDPAVMVGSSELPLVSSYEELIALKPDYCVIATPTFTHEELAIKLALNDINIFIEKPISMSVESASKIISVVTDKGLIGGVGHIERFNSAALEAKKLISSGEVGDVIQISTRRQGPFPSRITDTGVVIDLATHDIDLTSWLVTSSYKEISAFTKKLDRSVYEDMVLACGILDNGIIVSHLVNWCNPYKERTSLILTERGCIKIDTLSSDLTFYEHGSFQNTQREVAHFKGLTQGKITTFEFLKREPLVVEHETFRDGILGLSEEFVSLESSLKTIIVAERMLNKV
jgi:predicted dehydrogenase